MMNFGSKKAQHADLPVQICPCRCRALVRQGCGLPACSAQTAVRCNSIRWNQASPRPARSRAARTLTASTQGGIHFVTAWHSQIPVDSATRWTSARSASRHLRSSKSTSTWSPALSLRMHATSWYIPPSTGIRSSVIGTSGATSHPVSLPRTRTLQEPASRPGAGRSPRWPSQPSSRAGRSF